MKYSILIPTYNHVEDLKKTIESIKSTTTLNEEIEVIIVSNGCKDGTKEYIESLGDPFKLLYWDKPLGYTRAMNVAISLSDAEYVILLNNDIEILDWGKNNYWINCLEEPFKKFPRAGVSGPAKEWRGGQGWLLFCIAMIRRSLFKEIGLLDEIFSPGAGEDTDFCMRAIKAGYTMHQVPEETLAASYQLNYPIFHKGSATMLEFPNHEEIYARNEEVLLKRYGSGSRTAPDCPHCRKKALGRPS